MGTPLEVLREAGVAVLVLLASFGLGVWLLFPFRAGREEFLPFALALGMGGLGYLTFFVSLLRVDFYVSLGLILLGLALLGGGIVKGVVTWRGGLWGLLRPFKEGPHLALATSLVALGALLLALAPPTDWDGLSYHLAVPKRYLAEGRIHYIPDIHHSNFPATFEMLYLLALALGGLSAPKLLHFSAFLLCLALAHLWGVEATGDRRAGALAASILASAPVVVWEAGAAYIDLGLAMFETLALYSMWRAWRATTRKEGSQWLALSAIFAGLAAGTKITGLLCGLFLFSVAPLVLPKGRRLKGALLFGSIFLAVAAPWYLRSLIWTGNPVYPFAYEVFGGRNWDWFCARMYEESLKHYGMGRGLKALLLLPWNLTMHSDRFGDGSFLILTPGPLFLALLPWAIFRAIWGPKAGPFLRGALTYLSLRVLVWFWLSQQSRFLIPLLPLGAVAASVGVVASFRRGILKVAVEGLAVAVLIVHGALFLTSSLPAIYAEREEYLAKAVDIYPAQRWANLSLPEGAKILLIGETRGFYLDRRYMWGDEGHHTLLRYSRMRSAGELLSMLRTLGITHIMVNLRFAPTFFDGRDAMSRLFMELLREGKLRPLLGMGRVYLFEVVYEGGEG